MEALPSDRYFELVKTKEDYLLFISTGMAWEVEGNCPNSWQEHLALLDYKAKVEYCRKTRASNFEASCKLEGIE